MPELFRSVGIMAACTFGAVTTVLLVFAQLSFVKIRESLQLSLSYRGVELRLLLHISRVGAMKIICGAAQWIWRACANAVALEAQAGEIWGEISHVTSKKRLNLLSQFSITQRRSTGICCIYSNSLHIWSWNSLYEFKTQFNFFNFSQKGNSLINFDLKTAVFCTITYIIRDSVRLWDASTVTYFFVRH